MIAAIILIACAQPDAMAAPTPPPPPPASATRAASPPARPTPLELARRLAPAPGEATLGELRAAATSLAGADPERTRSMIARARRFAWLPELRVRYDRRFGRGEALDIPGAAPAAPPPVQLDTANDVRYEVRATWDLGRLVFSPEELHAHAEALRTADVRREVEAAVTKLYFERRRLVAEGVLEPAGDAADARRQIRIEEIEAELDALTGGAWSAGASPGARR